MQVILTRDVDTLGHEGDILNVADGYARNFLFPKKVAVAATEGSLKDLSTRIKRIKAKAEKRHQQDLANAQSLEDLGQLEIAVQAGEEGKLFGTVTTKEVAELLSERTELIIERKNVSLSMPISRVGEYTAYIKLSAKVTASVALKVVAKEA